MDFFLINYPVGINNCGYKKKIKYPDCYITMILNLFSEISLYFVRASLNTLEIFHRKFFTRNFFLCFQRAKIRLGCFLTFFFYFWTFSIVITNLGQVL
jgi:hypothetical protein